jgi:hypothetical protein
MFLSTLINTTSLVAPAVTLLLTFISYGKLFWDMEILIVLLIEIIGIAALKKQPHASTKFLGGTGVDNVV